MTQLSTVTPVYRGAETLEELVMALAKLREQLAESESPLELVESIFVDDGSTDGSEPLLEELAREYSFVRVVTLAKNFGQHPATMAGILNSCGDWVATLDEDLQHKPEYLIEMLQHAVAEKIDVVYAQPIEGAHKSAYRDLSSASFKWLLSKATGEAGIRSFSSFRLLRGSVARGASAVAGHQTYFDVAVGWFTNRVSTLALPMVDLRYQKDQTSGYGLRSLLSHGRRMLLSSDIKALRLGAVTGVMAMLFSMLATAYVLIARIFFPELVDVSGWASVMVAVLFLGGLVALLVGMLLESTSIVLLQSHGKPTFFEVDRSKDALIADWLRRFKGAP